MPWIPELFSSAPVLQRVLDERRLRQRLTAVPYFEGLLTGRGRQRSSNRSPVSRSCIIRFAAASRPRSPRSSATSPDTRAWLLEAQRHHRRRQLRRDAASRVVEEVVIHLRRRLMGRNRAAAGPRRRPPGFFCSFSSPLQLVAADGPPREPAAGAAGRPETSYGPDVVGEYQRSLAAGDVDGSRALPAGTAPPVASSRRPRPPWHGGRCAVLYTQLLLERRRHPAASIAPSATTAAPARWSTTSSHGAGRSCRPRRASPSTSAGDSGKLAAARIYDYADPPLPASAEPARSRRRRRPPRTGTAALAARGESTSSNSGTGSPSRVLQRAERAVAWFPTTQGSLGRPSGGRGGAAAGRGGRSARSTRRSRWRRGSRRRWTRGARGRRARRARAAALSR